MTTTYYMKNDELQMAVQRFKESKNEKDFLPIFKFLNSYFRGISIRYFNKIREDIIFKSIHKIYEKIEQYDESKALFKTWVTKIIYNDNLQYINKQNRIKDDLVSYDETFDYNEGTTFIDIMSEGSVENGFYENEERKQLSSLIDDIVYEMIKKDYYELYQYTFTNKSYNDLSLELEINVNTLKSRILRQRNLLKKKFNIEKIHF